MFFHMLSQPQVGALLGLAYHVVHADGVSADEEVEIVHRIQRMTGVSYDDKLPLQPIPSLVQAFESRQSKVVAILELLIIAHADGILDIREIDVINTISGGFGLCEEEVSEMKIIGIKLADIQRQVMSLLEGKG